MAASGHPGTARALPKPAFSRAPFGERGLQRTRAVTFNGLAAEIDAPRANAHHGRSPSPSRRHPRLLRRRRPHRRALPRPEAQPPSLQLPTPTSTGDGWARSFRRGSSERNRVQTSARVDQAHTAQWACWILLPRYSTRPRQQQHARVRCQTADFPIPHRPLQAGRVRSLRLDPGLSSCGLMDS